MQITRILPFSCHSATQTAVQYAKPIGIVAVVATLAAAAFAILRYYLSDRSNLPGSPEQSPAEQFKDNVTFVPPKKLVAPHPAEQPPAYNVIDQLPEELISTIFNELDLNSLLNAQLSQRRWYLIAETSLEFYVKARFGPLVAQTLRESQSSWRKVILFLNRPIEVKSNRLADHKCEVNIIDQTALAALEKVHKLAGTENFEELQDALEALRPFGFGILNHTISGGTVTSEYIWNNDKFVVLDYKTTPLAMAAASGIVKNAQLLVENGSADIINRELFIFSTFYKWNALFIAASYGHVDMVHYLLEQGAQPDPSPSMNLFLWTPDIRNMSSHQIFPTLINQYCDGIKKPIPIGKFLKCLILILNVWKGKMGIDYLRINKSANYALNLALEKGHSDIADLLIGYGIQPSHENCLTWAENGISNHNLPILEMLHRRQLFDFVRFRHSDGHTLLPKAIIHCNTAAIEFLQKIGVPNVIGKDGKDDIEAGRERFIKSLLIAILDAIPIKDAIRPYFADHRGHELSFRAKTDPDYLLRSCVELNSDLNFPLDDGRNTLLYHAVKEIFNLNAREYLTKILNYGANPHQAGISGITPLMEAERVYQEKQAEKSEEDRLGAQAFIQRMKELQAPR